MVTLRDYQTKALNDLRRAWVELYKSGQKAPRLLLVSRTGSGKTVVAGEFLRGVISKGKRANFVVRDRTLLDQTSRHLDRVGIPNHGVVAAGHKRMDPSAPVQVCSAQTLVARGYRPPADVLVFDEAHGIECSTSRAIVSAYPDATILGLTATPVRGDGKPLGQPYGVFERLVQVDATFEALVAQGALVDCDVIAPTEGRYSKTLGMDPVDALKKYGLGHKVVIFGPTVAEAAEFARGAAEAGFRADVVHGESANREDLLERIGLPPSDPRALDVLCNCDLLTQGWDCPPVDVLIIARGCGSWSMWMQICGRALRPIPPALRETFTKDKALIIDLRGAIWKHGHPGDDKRFALEGKPVRAAEDTERLQYCEECGATFPYKPTCPRCGAKCVGESEEGFGGRAKQTVEEREMMAVLRGSKTPDSVQLQVFQSLVQKAVSNGYKPGWVGFKFKSRYGMWPQWSIPEAMKSYEVCNASESESPNARDVLEELLQLEAPRDFANAVYMPPSKP
jgi:hypothetical protein